MPDVKIENLEKNVVKMTFVVTQAEAKPYLEEAAVHLSEHNPIPGFRPGKAGYEIVKQRVGEMKIMEEALETIVRKSYVQAILEHNIETVGSPHIDVEKLAPDNDIVFTAEVTRMPKATVVADYKKISVEPKNVKVQEKDVDLALKDLRRMQTKEVRATSEQTATENHKIVVSMNMKKEGVAVEGGQSPNHSIYLNEDYYIPGLKEKVIGMKEGEQRVFTLTFPDNHVQKMIAGKEIEFEITVNELYHLELPGLDDEFAKSLGLPDFATLKKTLEDNLQGEKDIEESQRQEKEMLEQIAEKSRFEEIPDLLVNEEINKMLSELQRSVENQGVAFEQYLKNLGKTIGQLKIDLTSQALIRIKVALLLRSIAETEKIEAKAEEIDTEIDKIAEQYKDEDTRKQIYSPQYREYTEQILKNRNTIKFLKELIVKH